MLSIWKVVGLRTLTGVDGTAGADWTIGVATTEVVTTEVHFATPLFVFVVVLLFWGTAGPEFSVICLIGKAGPEFDVICWFQTSV